MNNKAIYINTPVGRIVQGDCFNQTTIDHEGKPLLEDKRRYFIAIAIRKDNQHWPKLWETLKSKAIEGFPSLAHKIEQINSPADLGSFEFYFKVEDGDSPEKSDKPGFAGHWIMKFNSKFKPEVLDGTTLKEITDPNLIKRGYFVTINANIRPNESDRNPGLLLYQSKIFKVAYGEEIVHGPSAQEVYNEMPDKELPPGASLIPLAHDYAMGPSEVKRQDVDGVVRTESELRANGRTEEVIAVLPIVE